MAATFDEKDKALALKFGTATLHEAAGRIGAFPSEFRPLHPSFTFAGRAFTVDSPPFDNLWIHRAIYAAAPGDILIVSTRGADEAGYWGEILNTAAIERGIGGLVLEGGVRDTKIVASQHFPIFSTKRCIQGTGKDFGAIAWLNEPIRIGKLVIAPGDLIVGDEDGLVAIPAKQVRSVLKASAEREQDEAEKLEKIRRGDRTIDIYEFGEG